MRYRLTVLSGGKAGQVYELTAPMALVGRAEDCQVGLDPFQDVVVSQHHGRVNIQGGRLVFEDTSTNGSYVAGQPIKTVALDHGMVLQLGQGGPQLRFELLEAPSMQGPAAAPSWGAQMTPGGGSQGGSRAAAQPAGSSWVALQTPGPSSQAAGAPFQSFSQGPGTVGGPASPPAAVAPTPQLAPGRTPKILVEHLTHFSGARQEFDSGSVRFGRDPLSDVAFDPERDLNVSANHCKILFMDGRFVLLDNESTNGTFLDGRRVQRADMTSGQELMLGAGGPRMRISVAPPVEQRAAAAPGASKTILGDVSMLEGLSVGNAEQLMDYALQPGQPAVLGRGESCHVRLDSMHVSERHAAVEPAPQGWAIRDLASSNGTYVNGLRVVGDAPLPVGAEVVIGPYFVRFTGAGLRVFDTRSRTWVDGYHVTKDVGPGGKVRILDDVSINIAPGSFVALLGPSGAGKSTLLKALNGAVRASAGRVLVNNIDFYKNFEALKHQVGYVPQDDIIHPQLTIRRSLHYAAMLRMPRNVRPEQRRKRIDEVMSILELTERAETPISMLSGGQRKRVSIGVELLTEPNLLYLDEPTSGLSPDLEEKMMHLLRELALRGRTVVCVTHMLDNVHLCDRIAILQKGKLVFCGKEPQLRDYFQVKRSTDTYKKLEEHDPDTWKERFRQSPLYREHVLSNLQYGDGLPPETTAPAKKHKSMAPGAVGQFFILTRRYAELILRDTKNTAILMAQAPLIALFTVLAVTGDRVEEGPTSTLYLILGLAALWCGCSNAAREITKEAAIFKRERMVGQSVVAYVTSKFFVLSVLSFVQVLALLLIVDGFALHGGENYDNHYILGGVPGGFWLPLLNLQLTATAGVGIGLFISSVVNNSDKAMSIVPIVLIPQVLFSGAFGMSSEWSVQRALGYFMPLNWSLDLFKRISACAQDEIDQIVTGGRPECMYAFHPGQTRPLPPSIVDIAGQPTMRADPHEVMLAVSDGAYSLPVDLIVLSGICLALFVAVIVAVKATKR